MSNETGVITAWCGSCAGDLEDQALICRPCADQLADRVAEMPTLLRDVTAIGRKQLVAPRKGFIKSLFGPKVPIDLNATDIARHVCERGMSWNSVLLRHSDYAWDLKELPVVLRRGFLRGAPFIVELYLEFTEDHALLTRTIKQTLRGEGKLVGLCSCGAPATEYGEGDTQCTSCRAEVLTSDARVAAFKAYSEKNMTFTAKQLIQLLSQPDRPLTYRRINGWKTSGALEVKAVKDGTDRFDIIQAMVLYETRIKHKAAQR